MEAAHPQHGRLEAEERLLLYARRDLGAGAVRRGGLVHDDAAAGLACTERTMVAESSGLMLRRSMTSALVPSFASTSAACSATRTVGP